MFSFSLHPLHPFSIFSLVILYSVLLCWMFSLLAGDADPDVGAIRMMTGLVVCSFRLADYVDSH